MAKSHIRRVEQLKDARSIARFGITSIQVRLTGEDERRWESYFQIAGRTYQLQGFADLGRPRGSDTDVIVGLEAIFALQGFPSDNTIITSGYELAQAAHLPDNGATYKRLRESLLRYWRTGFIVREGFETPQGFAYYNETLGFFEKVSFWESSKESDFLQGSLSREKNLRVVLKTEFADSLRSGFIHHLDRHILQNLEQPPARALYRLLSAHRQRDDGQMQESLRVSIQDWRAACGIQDERPSKILRALAPAHEELLELKYLTGVEISGKGKKTEIIYHFAQGEAADHPLVQLLMQAQFGLSLPVAQQLAREHGQHVEAGIHFVQHRQASGGRAVANPAGLLRSALKEPEKYLLSSFVTPPAQAKPKTQEIALRQQEEAHASQEEIQSQIAELQSETPEAQWRSCKQALHLLLSKAFTQDEWKLLEEACVTGKLSAAHIMREASKAAATLQLQEFVIDLKAEVQSQLEDTQTGLIF